MIITCPACKTRYKVEPGQVGPKGRRVRCTACNHVWTELPAEDLPKVLEPQAAEESDAGQSADEAAEGRRGRGSRLGWIALAAVVLVLVVGATLGRDAIIKAWPPAERLYMAVGYTAPAPGEGLEIRITDHRRLADEGRTVLVIMGEINNVSSVIRDIPALRASLWSGNARELANWTFPAAQDRLLPGERVPFVTRYRNPPDTVAGVSVVFSARRR